MTCSRPLHLCNDNKRLGRKFQVDACCEEKFQLGPTNDTKLWMEFFNPHSKSGLELINPDVLKRIDTAISSD